MDIRIICAQCSTAFQVAPDRAGQHIACPTCFKRNYVEPPPIDLVGGTESAEDEDYRLSPLEDLPPRNEPSGHPVVPPEPTATPIRLEAAETLPHVPLAAEEIAALGAGKVPDGTTVNVCPECSAEFSTGQEHCHICFYHVGLGRIVDTRGEDDAIAHEFGFRRLLLEKLQKDQSPESVFFLIDTLILLASLLFVVFRPHLAIYIVPVAVIYITYRLVVRIGRLWYSGRSLLWRLVLFFGRALSWRTWSGKPRIASAMRGAQFGDDQLAQLADLDRLEVLDLEGTAITDKGLDALKHRSQLRFLILKRTAATEDGIWDLQQTIPKACIWY